MQLFKRWLGNQKSAAPRAPSQAVATAHPVRTRLEVAQTALRDVLTKHGIPTHWLSCELLPGYTRDRTRGSHVRLVMREWQPTLLPYTISMQRAMLARLVRLDPLSPAWFAGLSWKYDVVDDATCPALPPTHRWGEKRADATSKSSQREHLRAQVPVLAHRRSDEPADFRATEPMQVR